MRIAVIQPHYDDAVWSVGELMLARLEAGHEITIVTVFGGVPDDGPYRAKYETLVAEHDRAMEWFLGAAEIRLGLFDDAILGSMGLPGYGDLIAAEIQRVLQGETGRDMFDEWWVPVGIHHPDHLDVRVACGRIGRSSARLCRYEELPYRVLWPVGDRPAHFDLESAPPGHLFAKRMAAIEYTSQLGDSSSDASRCIFVPERLWRYRP